MKKLVSLVMAGALVLSLGLLAGCGSEPTDADQTADDSSAAAGLTTVTPGKLTMSTNASFPPYEYTDETASPSASTSRSPRPSPRSSASSSRSTTWTSTPPSSPPSRARAT